MDHVCERDREPEAVHGGLAGVGVRPGVRLALDPGSVRIGVAASDVTGTLASPVTVVRRDVRGGSDVTAIAALVDEYDAVEVYVGLPRSLSGREGPAAAVAREFAVVVAAGVAPVPVRMLDERLSTVTAARGLREAGVRGRAQRQVVDAAAAVVLLQSALDAERLSGEVPGSVVQP